jgi:Dullard-like phosphatase family protein
MKQDKNIEEIALKFLNFKETTFHHSPHQDSILTLKDTDLYGMNTSFPHSRQNSKLLSIVANNKVVGEYNINSFLVPKTKKVKLCQIPQKQLEEIEINCDIEDDCGLEGNLCISNNNNNNNSLDNIDYSLQLESLIDFQIVYDCIKQFYSPLIDMINQTDDDGVALDNTHQGSFLMYIENYINVDNKTIFFCCDKQTDTTQLKGDKCKFTSALNELKLIELMTLGYLIYSFQLNSIAMNDQFEEMNSNEHDEVTVMIRHCIYELYDDILLIILYFYNDWKDKEGLNNTQKMCFALVQDNYKNQFKPTNENIINKLLESIETIKKMLRKISETVINYLYHTVQELNESMNLNNNNNISSSNSNNSKLAFNVDFMDELTYFEKIIAYLKEDEFDEEGSTNCPNINNNDKAIKDKYILSYQELLNDVQKLYEIYLNFKKNSEVKVPYLPEMDTSKYIYTLVVDLDETLVHYVEEEEKAYVQVRPYAEYFLSEMSKYFEIVIFTAASEDYANIVLQGLDKNNSVSHKLSRRHTNQENGILLKDLSKLGRDITKICIIDNSKENFGLQPENGLNISSFVGDLNDDELLALSNDLMQIHEEKPNDIRHILKQIRKKMEERYKLKKSK